VIASEVAHYSRPELVFSDEVEALKPLAVTAYLDRIGFGARRPNAKMWSGRSWSGVNHPKPN